MRSGMDGSGLRQLTDTPATSTIWPIWPIWSPDGRRIWASNLRTGGVILFDPFRPWEEQTPQRFRPTDPEGYHLLGWSWSADDHTQCDEQVKKLGIPDTSVIDSEKQLFVSAAENHEYVVCLYVLILFRFA